MSGDCSCMGDVSKVEQKIWVLLDSTITSFSATPPVAPATDQPTSLSSPLLLPSPTLPEPYLLTHMSDTTSISRGPFIMTRSRRSLAVKAPPQPAA